MGERFFRVKVNGTLSGKRVQQNGTPQGSVLSIALFLIAINEAVKNIKQPVEASLYADDLVVYSRGKNLTTIQNNLKEAVISIESWLKCTGFKMCPEKTKCMFFTK